MNLDIRYPLGWIFVALGGVMAVVGLFTRGNAMYAMSEGVNLNLVWGGLMVVFGAAMLGLAKRAERRQSTPPLP